MAQEVETKKSWVDQHPISLCLIVLLIWISEGCFVHYVLGYFEDFSIATIFFAFGSCILLLFYEIFLILIWGSDTNKKSLTKVKGRLWRSVTFAVVWIILIAISVIFLEKVWLVILVPILGLGLLIMVISVIIIICRDGWNIPLPPS